MIQNPGPECMTDSETEIIRLRKNACRKLRWKHSKGIDGKMHLAMLSQTDADFPDPCSMIVLHILDASMLPVNAPRPGDQCMWPRARDTKYNI